MAQFNQLGRRDAVPSANLTQPSVSLLPCGARHDRQTAGCAVGSVTPTTMSLPHGVTRVFEVGSTRR